MILLRSENVSDEPSGTVVILKADRHTLAKRRWRATAEDGLELGFDLDEPIRPGQYAHPAGGISYKIEQTPEPVLVIVLPPDEAEGARIGWLIGNLHFPAQFADGCIIVCADPAVRQMVAREGLLAEEDIRVFEPVRTGPGHHHHDHHHEGSFDLLHFHRHG